ncbi:MAG: transposase [Aureliella sp.]
MKREDISTFNASCGLSIVERSLPHWSQAGTICFITWRLADSLPNSVLRRLDVEIEALLRREGLSPSNWRFELAKRETKTRGQLYWRLFQIREKYLDAGHGECWLANSSCSRQVLQSLKHFDEQLYYLTDAVIMPNHVHFLCAFASEDMMLKQCEDWKRFTARGINKAVGRTGALWQVDQYDHLVRSESQFEHFRRYIRSNPLTAGLSEGQFQHFSKPLPNSP